MLCKYSETQMRPTLLTDNFKSDLKKKRRMRIKKKMDYIIDA